MAQIIALVRHIVVLQYYRKRSNTTVELLSYLDPFPGSVPVYQLYLES